MDTIWVWGLVGAGLFVGLRVFALFVQLRTLLRLRYGPYTREPLPELPAHLEAHGAYADEVLGALGLEPVAVLVEGGPVPARPTVTRLYRDDAGEVWARVFFGTNPATAVYVGFYSTADEGAIAIETRQGGDPPWVPARPGYRVDAVYTPRFEDALLAHRATLDALTAEGHALDATADPDALWSRVDAREREAWEAAASDGLATTARDGSLRLTLRGAFATFGAARRSIKALPQLATGTAAGAPPATPEQLAERHLLREALDARTLPAPLLLGVLAVSGAAFAGLGALVWGGTFIPTLVLVLLVHELGHWAAMRLLGYRNTAIFFIPFFGAAASGQKRDAKLWQEILVLLAGPVPGLFLGLGLLVIDGLRPGGGGWLTDLGGFAVALNGLNLLPFFPLDGGRIVHRLLHVDGPWVDLALRLLAIVGFGLGALGFGDPLLGSLAVIVALGTRTAWRAGRLAARLRAEGVAELPRGAQLATIHRALLADVATARMPLTAREALAAQVEERLRRRDEPLWHRVPWLLGYGALLSTPIAAGVVWLAIAVATYDPSEVPVYACDAGRAPAEAALEAPTEPTAVVYACEGASEAARRRVGDEVRLLELCGRSAFTAQTDTPGARLAHDTHARFDALDQEMPWTEGGAVLSREAHYARVAERLAAEPGVDPEAVTLLQRWRGEADPEARVALAARLGADGCETPQLLQHGAPERLTLLQQPGEAPAPSEVLDHLCAIGCADVGAVAGQP